MQRFVPLLAVLVIACEVDLDLPTEPVTSVRVDKVEPRIVIASLGSPMLVKGTGLSRVAEVRVGPVAIPRSEFQGTDTEIMLHFKTDHLEHVGRPEVDGEDWPLRVVAPTGESTSLETVRVFSGRAFIDEITPADVAPGELMYLRGTGFDPDIADNNEVLIARSGAPCDPQASETEESDCVPARVFWAARGLVLALVPPNAPGGAVEVRYRNRAFQVVGDVAESWQESGREIDGFYASAPTGDGSASHVMSEAMDADMGDEVPSATMVWRPIGAFTVAPGNDKEIRISGSDRLCYAGPEGMSAGLRVFIDGGEVPANALSCGTSERELVVAEQAVSDLATGVRHSVQVVTPFHASPVAWF